MEATKKTPATRAALLVVAALSMLLSGLFIATTASQSDATPPPACPDGFALTADGKNCYQAAVVTSADNPNSCAEGQITPDGSKCYVPARVIPQEGDAYCPTGYSPDDSLGGMCARFEAATQYDDGCPEGARGVVGGCYILVAKGPAGTLVCDNGSLAGDICVIQGADPVRGAGTCPTGADIIQSGCYRIVLPSSETGVCTAPYSEVGGDCKYSDPTFATAPSILSVSDCPAVAGETPAVAGEVVHSDNSVKYAACVYDLPVVAGDCPNGSTLTDGECRVPVPLIPGALSCPDAGFGIVDGKCIAQDTATVAAAVCPVGSFEDSDNNCRKPVADADGAYYCKDADAALNGKSCVYTSPFLVTPAPDAYKCDAGTRAVIGDQVLCFLGDADTNVTSGPSCLQGVLSTDNLYCIVPRIDTAPAVSAPVPGFTG